MRQTSSTAEVPAPDRFEWFADVVAHAVMPTQFTVKDTNGFRAEGTTLDLGAAQVARFSYSPLRSRRTAALIRKADPEQYQLGLVTKGCAWFTQNGAEAQLRAGDFVLWDTSRPFESGSGDNGRGFEEYVLQIPKDRMPLPSQHLDRLLARPIRQNTGVGAILAQLLASVADNGPDCRPEELRRLADTAVDLAASHLSHHLGSPSQTSAQLRAEHLLLRVDAFIEHRLTDPELTPRAIAAHHHISLRHLYDLFETRGEGVAASIRLRRLERCRTDLADPDLRRQPVAAIAARWGFTSAAVFARAFRAAYDATPTEYRSDTVQSADVRYTTQARSTRGVR